MTRALMGVLLVAACSSPAATQEHADAPSGGGSADAAAPDAPGGDGTFADGTVGQWVSGPAMPVARANHCEVAVGSWVVVIGGNHSDGQGGFAATDEIDAAKLAGDGTLGPWQIAGHTASPVSEPTCTSDGSTIYVIDGLYDDQADAGQVFAADLDATGHLGALTSLGALPSGVVAIESGAAVRGGALLVTYTETPDSGNTTLTIRAPLGAGALAWTTVDWKIGFRDEAQYAFTAAAELVLGGYGSDADVVFADTFAAPLAADGSLGSAASSVAMPDPVAFGKAVAVDDFVFVVGGRSAVFGADGTANVFAAALDSDRTIIGWTTTTPLAIARTNHALAQVGDYLVVTGGATNGPGDTLVLIAQDRFIPKI